MILVTHGIIGAAAGSFFSFNPWLVFAAGFLSHFVADAIPHWHYSVKSFKGTANGMEKDLVLNRNHLSDILKIGIDFGAGLILPVFFFLPLLPLSLPIILLGAFAGILPDALQFAYMKIRREPFVTLQKFHLGVHAKKRLDDMPVWGISSQMLIAFATIFVTYWFLY